MRELERRVLLTVLDRKWREHLYEMDYLREGIGLRAMAQRDPLVEYQREGGDMFNQMMEAFMEEVVGFVFHLDVQVAAGRPQVGVVTDGAGPADQDRLRPAGGERPRSGRARSRGAHRRRRTTTSSRSRSRREPEPETPFTRPKISAKGLDGPANGSSGSVVLGTGRGRVGGHHHRRKATSEYDGVGRNAPCPCGSGKKFKMCHGRPGSQLSRDRRPGTAMAGFVWKRAHTIAAASTAVVLAGVGTAVADRCERRTPSTGADRRSTPSATSAAADHGDPETPRRRRHGPIRSIR